MQNCGDNVFDGLPVGPEEASLFFAFLSANDFSPHTRKAFTHDVRKFAGWFTVANKEPFVAGRVTVRDVTDFREHLRRDRQQAVASVNRCLVTLRRFFNWLVDSGHVQSNPAKAVKELRRQLLSPKGLEGSQVRRLLREIELRGDVRASAIFHLMLYTGCRVGDLVNLELHDIMLAERSGSVVYRFGKGNKQRTVPLPLPARRAMQAYLETRPPISSSNVVVGERGPLTDRGVRALCTKYGAIIGVKLHPHIFRHTFAHQFLADTSNDLVGLSQICGWEQLNTAARYTKKTVDQLAAASDRLNY